MRILSIRKNISSCADCFYLQQDYWDPDYGTSDFICTNPDMEEKGELRDVGPDLLERTLRSKHDGFLPGCPLKEGVL